MEPLSGSLRKRYDLSMLAKSLTVAGVPTISVNEMTVSGSCVSREIVATYRQDEVRDCVNCYPMIYLCNNLQPISSHVILTF